MLLETTEKFTLIAVVGLAQAIVEDVGLASGWCCCRWEQEKFQTWLARRHRSERIGPT